MSTKRGRRAFTLIELLIVIAIIGLLASIILVGLSGFRQAGRDARRLADIKQIQVVVERYAQRCGLYPMDGVNAGDCPDPNGTAVNFAVANGNQNGVWTSGLKAELVDKNLIGANDPFPQDPNARGVGSGVGESENHPFTYAYVVDDDAAGGTAGTKYILRARLEDPANPALIDDIDDEADVINHPPGGEVLDCDDVGGFYCISL